MSEIFQASAPLDHGDTLSDQVADLLRHNVISGDWTVGMMLPSEIALARRLDVSRTVIREAVSRLKAEGLLSSRQGRGAFVSSDRPRMGFAIAQQDVESARKLAQILELRMGLEIEATAIAARRGNESDCADIQAAATAFDHASQRDAPKVANGVSADLRFHRAICHATGNDYYLGLFNYLGASLRETILAGRLQALKRGGDSRQAVEEHFAIAAAITARDPIASRDRMRAHLEKSSQRLLHNLQPRSAPQ